MLLIKFVFTPAQPLQIRTLTYVRMYVCTHIVAVHTYICMYMRNYVCM